MATGDQIWWATNRPFTRLALPEKYNEATNDDRYLWWPQQPQRVVEAEKGGTMKTIAGSLSDGKDRSVRFLFSSTMLLLLVFFFLQHFALKILISSTGPPPPQASK